MQVLAGLFLIAFLVVIHEAGHFLVARLFGVGTPVFSVGFGPRIAGFRWRGTDFRLSAIPFGGYVLLAGADPFGEEDVEAGVPESERFLSRPVWQRLLVMAAGPAVNLALPFVLFTVLLMAGRPDWGTTVGQVLPGSPAEQAGLRTGDVVVAVDGRPAEVWTDVEAAARARLGTTGPIRLDVRRAEATASVSLPVGSLRRDRGGGVDLVAAGIQPWAHSARVGVDDPASPAGRSGLRTGDRIVRVDGAEVLRWDELLAALSGPSHRVAWERARGDDEAEPETGEAVLVTDPT
jgi:regulator of sigma E protease